MSANPEKVDEDKLFILLKKATDLAVTKKQEYTDAVALVNQIQSILNTEAPSVLTKKPLRPAFRNEVYKDIIEASTLLNLI